VFVEQKNEEPKNANLPKIVFAELDDASEQFSSHIVELQIASQ